MITTNNRIEGKKPSGLMLPPQLKTIDLQQGGSPDQELQKQRASHWKQLTTSISDLSCLWGERALQKSVPKSKQQCPWKSILAEGQERSPRPERSHGFDVVIGMDWLSKYHARILYDEKVVHIPINGETLIIRVFIDDILIYSCNKEEHADHLRKILELLRKEELYAKFSKCDFWISIVQFLGHVIDSQGIHVDPAKIEAVKNWASPTTPTEKNKKYIWGEDQESAFQLLKQKLCEAPILALPKGNDDFVVFYDASHQGLGVVLMQREKVIAYVICTDIAKISRKRSKPDNHGHENGIENIRAGRMLSKSYLDISYNGRAYWTLLAYPRDKLELLKALLSTIAFV
ncbi:putative reverse transcriptase domain-containing protein [Tanacetum coccineum]